MGRLELLIPSAESRRHTRARISLPVRIASIDPDRDPRTGLASFRTFEASTIDVCDGGLAISALEDLNCGRRVLVELSLPDGGSLELAGRIVWLEPGRQPGELSRMGVALARQSLGLTRRAYIA